MSIFQVHNPVIGVPGVVLHRASGVVVPLNSRGKTNNRVLVKVRATREFDVEDELVSVQDLSREHMGQDEDRVSRVFVHNSAAINRP